MDDAKVLEAYRERTVFLFDIQREIAREGEGTAKEIAKRKREELNDLHPKVVKTLEAINDATLYTIIYYYFVLGKPIDYIAVLLFTTPRRVNKLKNQFVKGLRKKGVDTNA